MGAEGSQTGASSPHPNHRYLSTSTQKAKPPGFTLVAYIVNFTIKNYIIFLKFAILTTLRLFGADSHGQPWENQIGATYLENVRLT